ncbi:MAG TPA: hypothetical protein VGG61_06385, partial [Gemmataceae bacterium]
PVGIRETVEGKEKGERGGRMLLTKPRSHGHGDACDLRLKTAGLKLGWFLQLACRSAAVEKRAAEKLGIQAILLMS